MTVRASSAHGMGTKKKRATTWPWEKTRRARGEDSLSTRHAQTSYPLPTLAQDGILLKVENSTWWPPSSSSGFTTWPQWNGRSFFQDHLWVIWTTEAGITTFLWFLVFALRLLLSQWFSCLAQFHLRGRGWTNFAPLFNDWDDTGPPPTSTSTLSHMGHLCGICYDIAKQYWAAWGLFFWKRSVSPSFLGVFLGCLFCFWLGFGCWFCCLGFVLEDTWLFALTYSPTCGNSQSKTIRFDDRLSLERARHELKKKNWMDMCGIWICVDMCGVRYANNLLKNPATKRLSGKTPRFVFCEVPMAFRWVEKRCFAGFGELRTILGWLFGLFLKRHQRCNAGNL